MNFKEIEAFRAVMMSRSMTTAAGLLHTSQPNVSRWIGLLERNVGFQLFQRVGTKLLPTAEAEAFYAEVERAFMGLESLDESANSIRRRGTGLLRIGAVGSIAESVLPDALAIFRQRFPDIPVSLNTGRSDVVAKWTATGFCDIGFCSVPTDLPSLHYREINVARGVCIVPRSHRLATRAILEPADFEEEHFISLPTESANRREIDSHFPTGARTLAIETPYATTICKMVGKGLGVSIVSPIVSRSLGLADLCEIPFSHEVMFRSFAVTSDHFPLNFLASRIAACVQQAFDGFH
ncbi:LysR substrate-binding domain-containing protein [Cupriavidus taiwanensis]|uniref:LysR substrate-binding domain-containing protein n=1 Tax=Cupriavidus taiwanensis TaxID=164546 RepID=UPI000E10B0CB|nr:LysR substrate-binding domain-containing protein [Cupriavidus taiwanensis]SOY67131.1 Transcriptional regulator LysR family protein [Cupriavidus taiwanensis]SOY67179.1 Transcriptional regulator LysR family protein [Cupriavidus taiwanensis]SOY94835.1 Transcriptional regulator LysR family protein [Cupriavidus taiwanensis]SOZ71750.1 Transcriptional regulator LysR family protein [Cupriavidus taiwanensis]SOZ87006.1 Transcriptional regulator LysR family protein [Cupriavidus taiwanensis]